MADRPPSITLYVVSTAPCGGIHGIGRSPTRALLDLETQLASAGSLDEMAAAFSYSLPFDDPKAVEAVVRGLLHDYSRDHVSAVLAEIL